MCILEHLKRQEGGPAAVDAKLHGVFAAAGLRVLLEAGYEMETVCSRLAASKPRKIALDLGGCAAFTDGTAALLAAALPPTLEDIRLVLAGSAVTPAGSGEIFGSIFGGTQIDPQRLRVLEMSDCLLACTLPDALGECTNLDNLCVPGNRLTGPIPSSIGSCKKLQILLAANNLLSGELPASLGQCVALETVRLNNNQLTGVIPPTLGACINLIELRLQDNTGMSGSVPESLAACLKLTMLNVDEGLLRAAGGGLPEGLQRRVEAGELKLNQKR